MLSYISGQTSLPWSYLTFLAHGHTIPCRELSKINSRFTSFLLAQPANAPAIPFPRIGDDPVNVLWMIPITSEEQQFAETHGSEQLLARAGGDRKDWIFNGEPKFSGT
ncbi:suppressor of fused domain protein [Brevibacillus formosus]|uniref:suppressor of fused domain protein n=1 Tax=Brevibacillus formosus TaxID=54913 RepID=UPI003F1C5F02